MQERSTTWQNLVANGNFTLLSKVYIDGVEYPNTTAPVIERGLFPASLSIGNCVSASLKVLVMTDTDNIPRSAPVVVSKQLTDGDVTSEEISAGTFFVSKRTYDRINHLLELQCFDSMLKANSDYPVTAESETEFPMPMEECVEFIAQQMGVDVDARTWDHLQTGEDYVVQYPGGLSMKKVLSYIAGANGGNWIITPDNKLRLVPISSYDSEGDVATVVGVLGRLTTDPAQTISRVSISDAAGNNYSYGDNTGYELRAPVNPYATQQICEDLYAILEGVTYYPYVIEKGIYDPAAELGDSLIYANEVASVLCYETAQYDLAFRGNVSAVPETQLEDEYPYVNPVREVEEDLRELVVIVADKANITELEAVAAQVENLSVSDIKAGIIRSGDYAVIIAPFVYPAATVFPAESIFPSNGEAVTSGFAIDFSTGMIAGAFYSKPIAQLQEAVSELLERVTALENSLTYPKARPAVMAAMGISLQKKEESVANDLIAPHERETMVEDDQE